MNTTGADDTGEAMSRSTVTVESRLQYEANIDDLDPRLWPHVIDRLLDAGADDAWVTPILMKKGRPAFTLGALCRSEIGEQVRHVFFTETSTIGLRESTVQKYALDRSVETLDVDGHGIDVKSAHLGGRVVNRGIEWDHVAAAAEALSLSAKDVLAAAIAQAQAD